MKILGFIFCLVFGLSAFAAQSGVFIVVQGKVYIESLNGKVVKAKIKSVISPGETVFSEGDSKAKIVMSDRNIINILPNTKLKIEKYTNEPHDKTVDLKLENGRIRTDVEEKYDGEKSKFEIKTSLAVIGVRGTQLVVSHNAATNTTEVVTLTGEVSVQRIGTLSGAMGFGDNGQLVVKTQEKLQVKKDSKSAIVESLKLKEFEVLKKETDVSVESEGAGGGAGKNQIF